MLKKQHTVPVEAKQKLGAVAHTFSPSTRKAEALGSLKFEASLVYRVIQDS